MQREFPVIKREHAQFLCMNQGGNADKARSLFRTRAFVFSRRRKTDYGKRTSASHYEDGRGLCAVVYRYCKKAELVDYSSVKGCMILRPYGYALWENMQKVMDEKLKETGHENVYMPMFIPESLLQREGSC